MLPFISYVLMQCSSSLVGESECEVIASFIDKLRVRKPFKS